MNRLSIQFGVGLLALALTTGASFAGRHKLNGTAAASTQPSEARGELRKKIIEKFDKDGDGKLNDEERAAAREAMKEHRKGGGKGGDGELRKKIIEKFDKDGDGKLNDEEKAAAKAAMKEHRDKATTKPSATN